MSILDKVIPAASAAKLFVAGTAEVRPEDQLPAGLMTVILLGPDEPAFWPWFEGQPEATDGKPDALDRWSRRVIGRLACDVGGKAYLPFSGPPYRPFIRWAERSGRAFASPVGLLVHDTSGLFFSVRGAIAVRDVIEPGQARNPCLTCRDQPCRTACPAQALTDRGYDVPRCHSFLDTGPGQDCMLRGCHVRRACPVGQDRRIAAQSAFHMKAFHPQ